MATRYRSGDLLELVILVELIVSLEIKGHITGAFSKLHTFFSLKAFMVLGISSIVRLQCEAVSVYVLIERLLKSTVFLLWGILIKKRRRWR